MMDVDNGRGPARHILPALAEFCGSKAAYSGWRSRLIAKMRVDGENMGGQYGQIATILCALKGAADIACSPYFDELMSRDNATWEQALEYLDNKYRDKQQQSNAMESWTRLRQGDRTFETYYEEFEHLLVLAGGREFPEQVKIQTLKNGTSKKLLRANASSPPAQTVAELAAQYLNIDRELKQLNAPVAMQPIYIPATANQRAPSPVEPMNIDAPGSFQTQTRGSRERLRGARGGRDTGGTRVNPNGAAGPGLPDDAGLRGKVARWVSREELNRRKGAGACFRCGRLGCQISVCPLLAPTPPRAQTTVNNAQATYIEPTIDMMVASESEN
jgi:hypothetical protein